MSKTKKFIKFMRQAYIVGIIIILLIMFGIAFKNPDPSIFALVIGVYLILTLIVFLVSTSEYFLHMLSFRKGFYFIFFGIIALSLINRFIDPANWQLLLQLAGVAIFIDLTLFQTPGISKIWSAELNKEEHSLKRLIENNRLLRNNTTKALEFHRVITRDDYTQISPQSWDEYKNILINYYSKYVNDLELRVHLIELELDEAAGVYNKLDEAFAKMLTYHSIQPLSTRKMRPYVNILQEGREVLIESDLEEKVVLTPFFGAKYGFLLSVVGKGEIEANEVDAMYLLNMAYINEWYMA